MKFKQLLFASLLTSMIPTLQAADHNEAPQVKIDPAADINDLYAFMNPNDANEVILAMTVVPFAGTGSKFSDAIEYNFNISNDNTSYNKLTCTFSSSNQVSCSYAGGMSVSGNVGEVITGSGMRVFTGLRDDPFFFDFGAFTQTVATLVPQFTNPGTDTFLGLDTLAIVVGIDKSVLNNNNQNPTLSVYASTNRLSGEILNGSVSGAFYNPEQSGHGFVVEVLDDNRIHANWYVFDNNGNQLWLIGAGMITGLTASVPVYKVINGLFPPNFVADDVTRVEVGTLDFEFSDCNNATVNFTSLDETSLNSTSLSVVRLTQIAGNPCGIIKNGQIDRMGRPAINTALINLLNDTGLKDKYNAAMDPSQWASMFQDEMAANLAALDTLDGTTGNALLDANTLASVLVNDVLLINTSIANCDAYLAVELGVDGQCGGRTLSRDVMDDTLGAVVGPGVSDGVANDNNFLTEFPFLGLPNSQ